MLLLLTINILITLLQMIYHMIMVLIDSVQNIVCLRECDIAKFNIKGENHIVSCVVQPRSNYKKSTSKRLHIVS